MVLLPSWLRDDEDFIVDNEAVIRLACWATGVYDKEYWYSGEIPDDVWSIDNAGLTDEVTELIEQGATWKEAFSRVEARL
jgi:hypothetical protein